MSTPEPEGDELKPFVPKKQTRKVERKLIPMIMKINPEDLNDSGISSRFYETVEKIFESMEDINLQELEANSIGKKHALKKYDQFASVYDRSG